MEKKTVSFLICFLLVTPVFQMIEYHSKDTQTWLNPYEEEWLDEKQCEKNLFNVEIVKPIQGYLYLNDKQMFPLFLFTLVIGPITFKVNVSGTENINKVDFYIDGELKHTDYYSPFSWECYEVLSFIHTLKVTAYDYEENPVSEEMRILFFNTRTEPLEDLKPVPFITSPSSNWSLYGDSWSFTPIYGNETQIVAVELNLASDIEYTTFEYSSDGVNWELIGVDNDTSFEGELFGEDGGVRNGIGISGWNIKWNISDLEEGFYYLKATMVDEKGQTGENQKRIYYDPTPPDPRIYHPLYGAEISGVTEFRVNTEDEDILYLELEFFNGSGNTVTQQNLGDVSQHDVGPNVDGSRRFDKDNNFCGPTAVANGLWRLAKKKPALKKMNKKDLDNKGLAEVLAKKMAPTVKGDDSSKTKGLEIVQRRGVATDELKKGVEDYLKEIGLGCDNENGYTVKLIRNPTWKDYERELKSGQCVVLLIAPKGKTSGHYVTGKSADKNENKDGTHNIVVVDPKHAWQAHDTTAKWGKDNNINFNGKNQKVLYMLVICPKNSVDTPQDTFVSIEPTGSNNRDYTSSDGWAVSWDTKMVHDGFFLVRSKMVDASGCIGTDTINTYVNNHPPSPMIISPVDGSLVNGTITLEAVDSKGSEDIVYTTFECWDGYNWVEIGTDTNYLDGWEIEWDTTLYENGEYLIKATMVDYADAVNDDTITVIVNNQGDETPPGVNIIDPQDGEYVTSPFNVTVYVHDDGGTGVAELNNLFEWDGGSAEGEPYTIDPPVEHGHFKLGLIYLEDYMDPEDEWFRITIYAKDAAGNMGSDNVTVYRETTTDHIPPVTNKEVGNPNEEDGYVIWPFTPIWLNATDTGGSGVKYIYFEIAWDPNEDGVWDETFNETVYGETALTQTQNWGILYGPIELRWYAVDYSNNVEETHYQKHLVATWYNYFS